MKKYYLLLMLLGTLLFSCREKYNIVPNSSDVSVLVVEGILINGSQPTVIKLSRSTKISSSATIQPVTQAQVTVEGSGGTAMSLPETGATGNYTGTLALDVTKEYRLRIKTRDGKEYLSDYVPVKNSPAIDSISWRWENNGVMFYASTHDASNSSRYYKWDFDETWEITSFYYSTLKVTNNNPPVFVPRVFPAEDVSHCWKYGTSNTIMLGSSAQLSSDVIFEAPLYYMSPGTEKIGVRYSVNVKQVVLTKQAYEFFNQMKKNTEQLGSIFDPLPSEMKGNIHCLTVPDEQVVGYVAASSQKEKRIFILSRDVPLWNYSQQGCVSLYVLNHIDSLKKYLGTYTPYDQDSPSPFGPPAGYYFALPRCSDCTVRGGNNVKPSYW